MSDLCSAVLASCCLGGLAILFRQEEEAAGSPRPAVAVENTGPEQEREAPTQPPPGRKSFGGRLRISLGGRSAYQEESGAGGDSPLRRIFATAHRIAMDMETLLIKGKPAPSDDSPRRSPVAAQHQRQSPPRARPSDLLFSPQGTPREGSSIPVVPSEPIAAPLGRPLLMTPAPAMPASSYSSFERMEVFPPLPPSSTTRSDEPPPLLQAPGLGTASSSAGTAAAEPPMARGSPNHQPVKPMEGRLTYPLGIATIKLSERTERLSDPPGSRPRDPRLSELLGGLAEQGDGDEPDDFFALQSRASPLPRAGERRHALFDT